MPSKVIRAADVTAMPIEFGFIPTERPEGGFQEQLTQLNAVVHEVCPPAWIVSSLVGDPGGSRFLRAHIPAPDQVGMNALYCQADSRHSADLRAAAAVLQEAVLQAIAPFVKQEDGGDAGL